MRILPAAASVLPVFAVLSAPPAQADPGAFVALAGVERAASFRLVFAPADGGGIVAWLDTVIERGVADGAAAIVVRSHGEAADPAAGSVRTIHEVALFDDRLGPIRALGDDGTTTWAIRWDGHRVVVESGGHPPRTIQVDRRPTAPAEVLRCKGVDDAVLSIAIEPVGDLYDLDEYVAFLRERLGEQAAGDDRVRRVRVGGRAGRRYEATLVIDGTPVALAATVVIHDGTAIRLIESRSPAADDAARAFRSVLASVELRVR